MVSTRLPQRAARSLALPRALICGVATMLLLMIPGCFSDPDDDPGPDDPPPITLQRNSIEKTIEYLEIAWRHQLYMEYEQVLHDQFEFFPLEQDAADFPWMTASSWSRTEELNIAAHMFDPNFSGNENPIDAITIELTELSRNTVGDRAQVTCTQQGQVQTSENNGWSFDTRVVIEIVPDPDEPGLFQVIKQTEIDPF